MSVMRFRRPRTSAGGDTVTVQVALRSALRDVIGPAARAHGFQGSAPNWRKVSDRGDWAIVNVQSSRYSSAESLRCVVNLSLAPEPWLAWTVATRGPLPKQLPESYGMYRKRLLPTVTPSGVDGWWEVNHPDEAPGVVADIARQLGETGWPTLERLLDRQSMLDQVRAGDLGFVQREHHGVLVAWAHALLVSDHGPSDELDEQLAYALQHTTDSQREDDLRFDAWVRRRAESARP